MDLQSTTSPFSCTPPLAESIGFEPMHPLLNDGLANRCLNHSANLPYWNTLEEPWRADIYYLLSTGWTPYQSDMNILPRVNVLQYGGRQRSRTPSTFGRTWFSRPVAGPSPLHYLPLVEIIRLELILGESKSPVLPLHYISIVTT
jgi:hypothetical protein